VDVERGTAQPVARQEADKGQQPPPRESGQRKRFVEGQARGQQVVVV
jgi:hypothetical protein